MAFFQDGSTSLPATMALKNSLSVISATSRKRSGTFGDTGRKETVNHLLKYDLREDRTNSEQATTLAIASYFADSDYLVLIGCNS